jgi:hypothetical protein
MDYVPEQSAVQTETIEVSRMCMQLCSWPFLRVGQLRGKCIQQTQMAFTRACTFPDVSEFGVTLVLHGCRSMQTRTRCSGRSIWLICQESSSSR